MILNVPILQVLLPVAYDRSVSVSSCKCGQLNILRSDERNLANLLASLTSIKSTTDSSINNCSYIKDYFDSMSNGVALYLENPSDFHSNYDIVSKILPNQIDTSINAIQADLSVLVAQISNLESEDRTYHQMEAERLAAEQRRKK